MDIGGALSNFGVFLAAGVLWLGLAIAFVWRGIYETKTTSKVKARLQQLEISVAVMQQEISELKSKGLN